MKKMLIIGLLLLLCGCGKENKVACVYREEQAGGAYDYMHIELTYKGDEIVKLVDNSEYKYSEEMRAAYLAAIDILDEYKKCPGLGNIGCSKYNEFDFSYEDGLIKSVETIDIKSAVKNGELELAFGVSLPEGAYLSKDEAIKYYESMGYSCK